MTHAPMAARIPPGSRWAAVVCLLALLALAPLPATDGAGLHTKDGKLAEPITRGQRVFTCGHSFHVWVPGIVADLCKKAEIPNHLQVGLSSIGGSKVIQHWNIAEG